MYLEYWGLSTKPFHPTPDTRFLYRSPQHEEAISRLLYAVNERLGAALLTGVFGCGKTLVLHALMRQLPSDRYRVALLSNPKLSYLELLMWIVQDLGGENLPDRRDDVLVNVLLTKLRDILVSNMKEGKETVVIIDEAHVIDDPGTMEGLRMLLNYQTEERFLLTLILSGQPELGRKVEELRQFEQRISIKWHLDIFSATETAAYIHHRMTVAGARRRVFSEDALAAIHQASGGIPRRINRLCDICLLAGFGKKSKVIDAPIVTEELASLGERA